MPKLKFTFYIKFLMASVVLLSACSPESLATTNPNNAITSTATLLPLEDPQTSLQPTSIPENTPVPSPVPLQWPIQPITEDNVLKIKEIDRWGRGEVLYIYQFQGSDRSLIQTPLGVYLYQSAEPYLIKEFVGIEYFLVSPDEQWLAGTIKGGVHIWNLNDLSLLQTIVHKFPDEIVKKVEAKEFPPHYVGGITFSSDSSQIAVGFLDGSVELWRIGENNPYLTLRHDSFLLADNDISLVYTLRFSPDGKSLVVFKLPGIGGSNRMTFWSIPSGKLITISRAGRFVDITEFAFLPNSQTLVVFMRDSSRWEIGFWDVTSGSELSKFGTELSQIDKTEISSDGNQMIIYGTHVDGTYQRQVNKLPEGTFVEKENLEGFPLTAEQKAFEEFLFVQGHYSNVWEGDENLENARLDVIGEQSFRVLLEDYWLTFPENIIEPLNLPPDIPNLYFDIQEQSVTWCESRGLHFQSKNGDVKTLDISAIPSCDGISISPEREHISVWRDGSLYLINYDTGWVNNLVLNEPRLRWSDIAIASFSPNEEFLVSVKSDLVVWRVNSPQKLAMGNARGATGNIVKMVISNDNSFVVTLNAGTAIESDRTSNLTIWRLEDASELIRISSPFVNESQPKLETFALSPDDKMIVTGDDFGGVRFWSVKTGSEVAFIDFDSVPLNFAFTSDGSGLIILLSDGTIRLWGIPQT